MMIIFFKRLFLGLSFLFFSFASLASTLSEIPKQVFSSSKVTKEQHDIFWAELNKVSKKDSEFFLHSLKKTMIFGQEVQIATWKAVSNAYKNRDSNVPEELKILNGELLGRFKSDLKWPEGSPDYNSAVERFERGVRQSMESTKQLLLASANHGSLSRPDGTEIEMTQELIDQTLSSLEERFIAVNKLLDSIWKD